MAIHHKTAPIIKLLPVLMALLMATVGCSNHTLPKQGAKKSPEVPRLTNQNYDTYLQKVLTEPKTRQSLLHFAVENREFQAEHWRHYRADDYISNAITRELTTSWHLLDKALYELASRKMTLQTDTKATANSQRLSDFISSQQDSLIKSAFTTYYFDSATKHRFKQRQQLIRQALDMLQLMPQTADSARTLLDIEKQASDLEKLYQTLISETQIMDLAINNNLIRAQVHKANFNRQVASPSDLIMKHSQLINIMINLWRNEKLPSSETTPGFDHHKQLWRSTFSNYPYLLPTNPSYGSAPVETWIEASKRLVRELEKVELAIEIKKNKTPRGVVYSKEDEQQQKLREQLFEIMLVTRLRVALLNYAHHYDFFRNLKQQTKLQKLLTSKLSFKAQPDKKALLNNIHLCSLEIQTHLAYSQLLASLERVNASTNILNKKRNIRGLHARENATATQAEHFPPPYKPSLKNLLNANIEHVFVSANSPSSAVSGGNALTPLKPADSFSNVSPKVKKVETLSSLHTEKLFTQQAIRNTDLYGIRLLYAKSHAEFTAHREYSGLKNLPYRTQLKGYDTHYSIYYATYPSKEAAAQGLKEIPPFYQLFKPVIKKLPN